VVSATTDEPKIRKRKENKMAKWENANGDTITTEGTIYTIVKDGVERKADVSRWTNSAEKWIESDIKNDHYEGFKRVN